MVIKKSSLFGLLKKFSHSSENTFILLIFTLPSFFFIFSGVSSFRVFLLFYLTISVLVYLKIKNLALSFFLTCLFTLPFFLPAKSYNFLVLSKLSMSIEYKGDYLKDYALNTSNIFLFLTILVLIRNIGDKIGQYFRILKPQLLIIAIPFLIFFLAGFFSSHNYSPFFLASFIWLLQYSQLFIIAFMLIYFFKFHRKKYLLIPIVLLASVFFESSLSLLQLVKQSQLGIIVEREIFSQFYVGDLDAIGNLYRVYGTASHPNQLAFIMIILIILLAPYIFGNTFPNIFLSGIVLGLTVILLTQSRSVWIGLIISSYIFIKFFRLQLISFFQKSHLKKRYSAYLIPILALLSFVIVPRIMLSSTIFYQGGALDIRSKMLQEAIVAFAQNPWFGYGVGTNEVVLYNLFPRGTMAIFPSSIHMGFVQLILEVGLIGLLSLIFPFIFILFILLKTAVLKGLKNQGVLSNLSFSYLCATISILGYSFFQPFWGQYDFAYLGIVLGTGLNFLNLIEEYQK